jgi:hypothetical protein
MSLLAVSQIDELASLVYQCVPAGAVMVDNLREMLLEAVEAKNRAKYSGNAYAGTFVMPTSDMLSLVKVQLPFMPECIKYVGCKSIKYAGGLFVPCGGKIKSSDFCNTCSKKAAEKGHEFGTYDERKDAFDNEQTYSVGEKTEISYGDYLVAKKLTAEEVKLSIRSAGLSINVPTRCLAVTGSAKKRSGRPSKKAEAAPENADSDGEIEAPKPKAPRAKLSIEEKIAKLKADEELKAQKAEQKAAEKLVRDAKKAELEKAKADARSVKDAEKAAKNAEGGKEKAAKNAEGGKKKKATEKKVKEALASLDSDQEGEEAEEVEESQADFVFGEISEPEEEEVEEEEKFTPVTIKGVPLQKGEKTGKIFADTDKKRRFLIAEWDNTQKAANFVGFEDVACSSILEEIFAGMMEKKDPKNRLLIGGKVHDIDYENGHIKRKGKVVKVFLDGEIQDPEDESDEDN